ncbi:MAG TPA: FKBP-type peptidyl-prolyl cis-trans isomerase [Polyangiaceae bacterium]|nr:FKBP-type peptidyl-prolyl cis-trans isomerase [Polyangiaceae bacterium]
MSGGDERVPTASTTPAVSSYQAGPGLWVEIAAAVYDADDEPVAGAEEVCGFVFGFGQALPGLERGLEGHVAGDQVTIVLAPHEAYGARDESLVVSVAREELGADIRPGDRIEVEDAHGAVLVLRVLELDDEEARVDFNHPLAGQKVRYETRILQVRPATEDEIVAAERALEENEAQTSELLPPERLLRGVGRGYENAHAGRPAGESTTNEPPVGSVIEEKKHE